MTAAPAPAATRPSWIPALGGLRALAALAVFGFHLASVDTADLDPVSGAAGRWINPLGNAAVAVFFVLSGFLVFRPFARWALLDGPRVTTGRFLIRRMTRILPLYWVILAVHLTITGNATSVDELVTAATLTQNFRGAMVFVPPFVAWSLSIELWFSAVLPIVAYPMRRLSRGRSLESRVRIHLWGIAALAATALGFRVWALSGPANSGRILWMPAYLDWFGAGLLLAVVTTAWTRRTTPTWVRPLAANPWALGVAGVTAYWAVTQIGLPGGFEAPTASQSHAQFLLEGVMSLLFVGALVLPDLRLGRFGALLESRLLQAAGVASYGIYLLHPVVVDTMIEHDPSINRLPLSVAALGVTAIGSTVLQRTVEGPASRTVDRWLSRTGRAPEAKTTEAKTTEGDTTEGDTTEGDTTAGDTVPLAIPPITLLDGPTRSVLGAAWVSNLVLATMALSATVLSFPGRYVADSRFELSADPGARLARLFILWDGERDLGRTAEEFWPGLTTLSWAVAAMGASPWILQRVVHAILLSLAATGVVALSRRLRPDDAWAGFVAAILYAFGPFSAIYLVPSPLYVSHALAPWLVVAVLSGARARPLAWGAAASLAVFAAGNADPPGIVYASVPAIITASALVCFRPERRRNLHHFAVAAVGLTATVSAAMLVKTATGAAALSHRLLETEPTSAIAATSSFTESMRGTGFWLLYLRLGPTLFRTHQQLFVDNGWMILATAVPLVVGIAMMARRRTPAHLMALLFVIVGTVLMAGAHGTQAPTISTSPYSLGLNALFERSPLAFGFRSTHKAGTVVALGVALIGGWGLVDLVRIQRQRRIVPGIVVALLALLASPFWRTSLYDPAVTSTGVPDHWHDAQRWLTDNAEGRVLVVPGSTNNGYRWGSVGDDVLDPFVPGRVVASTLPLSTATPADLIAALDAEIVGGRYRHGTLGPLAQRLGISHLLIRNDLEWERQGLARPSALDAVRSDPDLLLAATFGRPGPLTTNPLQPQEDELTLPPIEVYALSDTGAPQLSRIAASDQGRQILLDGAGKAIVDLSSAGVLDHGHPVQLVGDPTALGPRALAAAADDAAVVVLSDSNRATERRINYYGFDFTPARDPDAANRWLDPTSPETMAWTTLFGAEVRSGIDRWLLGESMTALAAIDDDPASAWTIPVLSDPANRSWGLRLDEPQDIGRVTITLRDDQQRIRSVMVSIDGTSVRVTPEAGHLEIMPEARFQRLQLTFDDLEPGLQQIGIADVRFERHQPVVTTSFPTAFVDRMIDDALLQRALADTPLLIAISPTHAGHLPVRRQLRLWRADRFELSAAAITDHHSQRCVPDALRIDGRGVGLRITPDGDGKATVDLCPDEEPIQLTAGDHSIELVPAKGDQFSMLTLTSAPLTLTPIERSPVHGDVVRLRDGDLLLAPVSFDRRWRLESGVDGQSTALPSLEPVALDGLTAWHIDSELFATAPHRGSQSDELTVQRPVFGPDRSYRVSLAFTLIGLVLAAAVTTSDTRGIRSATEHPTGVIRAGSDETSDESTRAPRRWPSSAAVALATATFLVGLPGVLGVVVVRFSIRRGRLNLAIGTLAAAFALAVAVVAAPVLLGSRSTVDPAADDWVSRAVIGGLLGLLGPLLGDVSDAAARSRSSTTPPHAGRERT